LPVTHSVRSRTRQCGAGEKKGKLWGEKKRKEKKGALGGADGRPLPHVGGSTCPWKKEFGGRGKKEEEIARTANLLRFARPLYVFKLMRRGKKGKIDKKKEKEGKNESSCGARSSPCQEPSRRKKKREKEEETAMVVDAHQAGVFPFHGRKRDAKKKEKEKKGNK